VKLRYLITLDTINFLRKFSWFVFMVCSSSTWAADPTTASPSGGLLKMLLGLVVVLAVMAGLAWLLKRLLPGASGSHSVARIVGGVSVGSRERVVVVEVADRWIVVGVAPGSVNGLANLDAGTVEIMQNIDAGQQSQHNKSSLVEPFAEWMKKSLGKQAEKSDVKK
jgi:flagellar protein FliO/FliZ